MYPPGHLAFGYVCYSLLSYGTRRRPPRGDATLVLAFGTQFPDLVDKPLAMVGILRYGRSLAHSAVTVAVVAALLWFLTSQVPRYRWLVVPFVVGMFSHTVSDFASTILYGSLMGATFEFLFWPLTVDVPPYTLADLSDYSSFPGVTYLETSFEFVIELFRVQGHAVWVVAAGALWYVDGKPGLSELKAVSKRR